MAKISVHHSQFTFICLSVVSLIFLPLTFITGLLGINVPGIPGQDFQKAFEFVCGGLLAVFILTIFFLRQKKMDVTMFRQTLAIIIFLCASLPITEASAQIAYNSNPSFDITQAKKQIIDINQNLSTAMTHDVELYLAIQNLKDIQEDAKLCVEKGQKQLKIINKLLDDIEAGFGTKKLRADVQYLEEKQTKYLEQTAECRLLALKTEETLLNYKDTIGQLNLSKKLKKTIPIWSISYNSSLFQTAFNLDKFIKSSGLDRFDYKDYLGLLSVLFSTMILGLYIRKLFRHLLDRKWEIHNIFNYLLNIGYSYVPVFIALYAIDGFFEFVLDVPETATFMLLINTVTHYVFLLAAGKFLLTYPLKTPSDFSFRQSLFKKYLVVLTFAYMGLIIKTVFMGQPISLELSELARIFYIILLSSVIYKISYSLINEVFELKKITSFARSFSKSALSIAFVSTLFFEWIGYHHLSIFIVYGTFLTALLFMLMLSGLYFLEKLLSSSEKNETPFMLRLRDLSGIKPYKKSYELFILKLSLQAIIVILSLVALLKTWGISLNYIDVILESLMNGFVFFDINVYPLRIVLGLFVFSVILIAGRILATHIARHAQFEGEESRQVTIASIVNYTSFFGALMISLVVAGVNFTGLAIILGALSVGIGFGLQNIVNNFICGIILLIQRPIKPGDRIITGNVEGFVRKIRVLSTQINTLSKEDVLIPNASLIYEPVTNLMFRDRLYRVRCQVGVMYGSNLELVKRILLEVRSKNPDVLQDQPNQPFVLFKAFADSSLNFELYCVIFDVNKKYQVASDLNYEINAAFAKHEIVIAFPQRDVHIRDYVNVPKT